MRNRAHYERMLSENPGSTVGVQLAARAVYAARHGDADAALAGEEHDVLREMTRDLIRRYGQDLTVQQLRREMNGEAATAQRRAVMSDMGRVSAQRLTPAQRRAKASAAGQARWDAASKRVRTVLGKRLAAGRAAARLRRDNEHG